MAEEIRVPALGESITEATVGKWFKQPGDAVAEDEPIAELETDKVVMEVNAPVAGVITEHMAAEGDDVEVGAVLAMMEAGAIAGASAPAASAGGGGKPAVDPKPQTPDSPKVEAPKAAAAGPTGGNGQPTSPAVRKLIADNDLDVNKIIGTGKDGRLTKADVLAAVSAGHAKAAAGGGVAATPTGPREERVPMSRLRKKIAESLKNAQNTAAMLTTYNEVDMTAVMAARLKYREEFEKKHGVRLGFMSFFTKACIHALKEIPSVNAEIDGDEIVYKNHYDISVAVSSPGGLVVPVVRDADLLSFAETEKAIGNLGRKARDGKITLDDMTGGTFTISNGGVFGSLMSSPILNAPQSGILGMHKIQERPMVVNGEIVIRPMMYLALSYDHRIIDGREAVTFLVRVKDCIENPERLLFDV
jgi:2-oxoglutarate dehydrogenase E2 component (dihydrolipoamide succinyltransferase)